MKFTEGGSPMGTGRHSDFSGPKIETPRVKSFYHREYIAELSDREAKEYLLGVVEREMAEAQSRFCRIKDTLPHANRQSVQILDILWNAGSRIRTYDYIGQELEYLNGRYLDKRALSSAVKLLRRALVKDNCPLRVKAHYGIGYNLDMPDGWQAPWATP